MDGLELYTLDQLFGEISKRANNCLLIADMQNPGDQRQSIQMLFSDRFAAIGLADYVRRRLLAPQIFGDGETQFDEVDDGD